MTQHNELVKKLCNAVGIFPEELEDNLPNSIGANEIKKLESVVNLEVHAVLDRLHNLDDGTVKGHRKISVAIEIERANYE